VLDVDIECHVGTFRLRTKFSVPATQTVAIFGRSGTGKTTLLHALAGVVRPERGSISLDRVPFFDSSRNLDTPIEERRIGYLFQEGRLFPHLSVARNVDYGTRRQRGQADGTLVSREELVDLLGLSQLLERRTVDLSGGELQRVALARALLARPRLLLLDEPLAALDMPRKQEIMGYIERLRKATGVPMVIVTHALDEVVRLADQLVVLDAGTIRASGETAGVLATPEMVELFGQSEASAIISGTLVEPSSEHSLARVAFNGGMLYVASQMTVIGAPVRVRVRTSDVSLALEEPRGTSVSNVLAGTVVRIVEGPGPNVQVLVAVGETPLLASITHASRLRLGLKTGMPIWAMVKGIALLDSNSAES
jgi:molybdate transport system ATP-binding protein